MPVLYFATVPPRFSSRLAWPAVQNSLGALKAELRAEGRPILDFSDSNPTRVGLRGLEGAGLDDLLDFAPGSPNRRYDPDPRGLMSAREALAARSGGRIAGPERLFLCASTSEAYGWIFKLLCDPGDAVLVPKPGYPLFDYLAGLESVEPRPYRLEYRHPAGWNVDLESLEAGLRRGKAKAVVLIHPNNPTGSYVARAERAAILDLAARYGVALVVDEVFFPFPVEAGPVESWVGEERVLCLVLDGLSKGLGLPQLKLGWISASGPASLLAEALGRLEIVADTYLSASTPAMNALPRLLDAADAFRAELRVRLRANLEALRAALGGKDSVHRVLRCDGGWTAIVESPRLGSEEELALGLLAEEGLWTQPGFLFDLEREAYFTASLILEPRLLVEGAGRYRAFFGRRLG